MNDKPTPPSEGVATSEKVKTINKLHKLSFEHPLHHTHIIIGPNGQCMCGVYEGIAFTCKQILQMRLPVNIDCRMEAGDGSDY